MSDPTNSDRERQRRGVDAQNQDFRGYEQVRKDQRYRLSEAEGTEEFDDEFVIRTCDMREFHDGGPTGRDRFAAELGAAFEEIGFAILIGHGIPLDHYADLDAQTLAFYDSTTAEQRSGYRAERHGSVNQGYFPLKETSQIHPDLVEGWVFCRRAFDLDGDPDFDERSFWPISGFEPVFRRHCELHEALIAPLMQSILRHLGCDPHLYDEKLTRTNFGFRLNYYPPIDSKELGGRMLGHEDVDLFTLLPAPAIDGLQILNRENMKWIRLSAPPGSIIINVGDYLQRISNDRLPSTTHRVARPRSGASGARVSAPMAIYVWEDEVLEVLPGLGTPRYPPIGAEQFHTKITSKYYGDDYATDTEQPQHPE